MRKDSNDVGVDASNLDLDERLVFHDYLASDKTLKSMPVTDDASTNRPDILATRVLEADSPVLATAGQKLPLQSIVVVELSAPCATTRRRRTTPSRSALTTSRGFARAK